MEAAPNTLGSSSEATSPTSRIRGSGGSVVVVERKEETTQSMMEDIMDEEVGGPNTIAGLAAPIARPIILEPLSDINFHLDPLTNAVQMCLTDGEELAQYPTDRVTTSVTESTLQLPHAVTNATSTATTVTTSFTATATLTSKHQQIEVPGLGLEEHGGDAPEIEDPNFVTLSEENVVFELIPSEASPFPTQTPNILNSLDPPEIIKGIKTEGDQIMSQLTGFGLSTTPQNFQQLETRLPHQDSHHIRHQDQNPPQRQGVQQPHQSNMGQLVPSDFIGQNGTIPYVKIIEEPAGNKLRFRYECEGRSAGALHGVNYTPENKTYPAIQIIGYTGPAVVVVSCVEEKPPYKTHPHKLVGKDGMCKKGVCSLDINNPDMIATFQNLGIQCVRRKDAPASLAQREKIQVDPFKQGFAHANLAINLNAIRLCFQVFLKTQEMGLVPLAPIVSKIIQDKKAHSELQIIDYSDDSSPVEGGKKILLFCEKVDKNDVEVHFTLFTKSGEPLTCKGEFTSSDVHKQFGISLKTPKYPNQAIKEDVQVQMYLYKPSDKTTSEPVDFWYMAAVNKEENRSPRPTKGRPRHENNQNEPSSGQRIVPPKIPTAQYRGGGGGVVVINQNQNNEYPSVPQWNVPSQYSMIQPPQHHRQDMVTGDHNLFPANAYPPDVAVSPPAMAPTEAPANWHAPTQPKPGYYHSGSARAPRSFTDLINASGPLVEQSSTLNSDIIKEALAADSLTNLDLNTGDINEIVQGDLSGKLKEGLKLETSPSKASMIKLEYKETQESRWGNGEHSKQPATLNRQSSQLHTPDVSMSSNVVHTPNSSNKKDT